MWFARKAALEESDTVAASARVEEMRAYMRQEGITADRGIARGFAYEGYENLREGNYERAREAFDLARSFDPYMPQAQRGYAWSLLRAGRGVTASLNEYAAGMKLGWKQFRADEVQSTNFSAVAALAFLCSLMAFSLVVIARCQGRLRHDLFESFRRMVPEGAARLLAWVVFLLPLLFWIGGLWLLLFWLAICFRYMRWPERVAAGCVFVMLGLAPLGVTVVLDRFQAATDPETRVVVSAMQSGYNPETLRRLQQVVAAHEEAAELHLLLGTSFVKGDLLGDAFDEFQRVLDLNPASAPAFVNTGNVYFRLGEHAQAVSQYKRAIELQPDLAPAYWNLYLAQGELFHFAEADESLARARSLDAARVGELLSRKKGQQGAALLIDEMPSLPRLKDALKAGARLPAERVHVLMNPFSLACGAGLVFALLLSIGGSDDLARACARCGRAFCPQCRLVAAGSCCTRCVSIFQRTDGITADVRAEELAKLERLDRLATLSRRALTLGLPGSGQLLAGRVWIGFFLMTGWVCAIIYFLTKDRLLLVSRVPVSDLPAPAVVAGGLAMIVLWIVGNAVSTRRRVAWEGADGA
ncbi:MAG TPA: tetratricopeptide repeat protein [Candidatus Polarisedimenticolia bacterium]|nr:tetratricopeptide repeat protein [Candidatus Polarisedimenticolia bacterium]